MSIPPIISNLPLFRLFKSGGASANKAPGQPAQSGGDIVEISDAAQKKLDAAQVLSAQDPGRISAVTSQIRQYLEQQPVSLGLNPAFER
jgi:hypothetical protein